MLAYLSNDTTMKFEEILHHYQIRSYSEHGIAFHRITPSFYEESSADVIIEEHSILIVTAGQLNIELAGKPYCLTGNSLVDTGDEMIPLRILQQSADIQASLLILSKQFRRELLARRPTFPISYLMRIKLHPILTVDTERLPSLRRCLDNIVSSMDEQSYRATSMQNDCSWSLSTCCPDTSGKNMEWDFTPRSCASPPNIWGASSVSLPERPSITGFAKHWSARLPSFCQTRTPACRRLPTNCTSLTRPSCPRCSNASRVSLRQSTETRLPEGGPSCPRRTACADPKGRQTPRRFSSFILRNW